MMKKIYTEVKLTNYEDIAKAASGIISENEIRRVEVAGRIDIGSTHLALPKELVEQLCLQKLGQRRVRYADGRTALKYIASVVEVEINSRTATLRPVIEQRVAEVLIGNTVLEEMDLFLNPKTGELYPNPESPDRPLVELL